MAELVSPPVTSPSVSKIAALFASVIYVVSTKVESGYALHMSPSTRKVQLPLVIARLGSTRIPQAYPGQTSP